jgi:hypothetical protein
MRGLKVGSRQWAVGSGLRVLLPAACLLIVIVVPGFTLTTFVVSGFSRTVYAQAALAQGRGGRAAGAGQTQAPPPSPRAGAPVDLTGTWVAIVTEDWRWRMVTPPKGDVSSVPLNAEGRKIAESWDPATDGSCKAYGAGAIMRMPGRIRISWQDDNTLKIETDAGQQTRLFSFDAPRAAAPSLQGTSVANWERPVGRGGPVPVAWAPLKVVTRNLTAGWLRKNGVPYSANATVTEYFYRHSEGESGEWLTVSTMVEDPAYLAQPFLTSSSFRKEANDAKWKPVACRN